VTAPGQGERSATFSGEMTAIPGSVRMAMRIDILERMPGQSRYRTITAPGLGVWRWSEPGVKTYRYLKQVTNLGGPASYRAAVRFHWLNSKGHLIRTSERFTPKCDQPGPSAGSTPTAGSTTPAPGTTTTAAGAATPAAGATTPSTGAALLETGSTGPVAGP
jgi:hypothetical protein